MKECPVCYLYKPPFELNCGHSFCYQCVKNWYQNSETQSCPLCRQNMAFREVYIECDAATDVMYAVYNFQRVYTKLSKMHVNVTFDDLSYFIRQPWCLFVSQNNVSCDHTRYIFIDYQTQNKIIEYGIRIQKACHKKRQEEQEAGVFTETHKNQGG